MLGEEVTRSFSVMLHSTTYIDNILLKLGTDSDIVLLNRSGTLNADTAPVKANHNFEYVLSVSDLYLGRFCFIVLRT